MLKTREEIEDWLSRCSEVCGFREYKINDNLVVDVNGTVDLANADLEEIPLQFGIVTENFHCENNKIKSLKGAPHTVGLSFLCFNNELTTLENGPQTVGCGLYCSNNKLTNLTGAPKKIGGNGYLYYDGGGYFVCGANPLLELGVIEKQLSKDGEFLFYGNLDYPTPHIPELSSFRHYENNREEKVAAEDFNRIVNELKLIREEKAKLESNIEKVFDGLPAGTKELAGPHPKISPEPKVKQKFKL